MIPERPRSSWSQTGLEGTHLDAVRASGLGRIRRTRDVEIDGGDRHAGVLDVEEIDLPLPDIGERDSGVGGQAGGEVEGRPYARDPERRCAGRAARLLIDTTPLSLTVDPAPLYAHDLTPHFEAHAADATTEVVPASLQVTLGSLRLAAVAETLRPRVGADGGRELARRRRWLERRIS